MLAQLGSLLLNSLLLSVALIAPFVAFALIIHWLERVVFVRLAARFGWRVSLWTGWLGTPIHELSHAVMCRIFHHRIDEMALFEPDLSTGRLGYVKHSYRRGNWYQELGNFFIGIAPLIGGSLVLGGLLWLFYRDAATAAMQVTSDGGPLEQLAATVRAILEKILTLENVFTFRFWIFLYLVLCVGGHMAPSRSDYQGAGRGVFMVVGSLLATGLVLAILQIDLLTVMGQAASLLAPLYALLILTVTLCGIATTLVVLITHFIPRTRRLTG